MKGRWGKGGGGKRGGGKGGGGKGGGGKRGGGKGGGGKKERRVEIANMTMKAWEHYITDDSRTSVQNCQILQHRLPRHKPCFLGYQCRFPGDEQASST